MAGGVSECQRLRLEVLPPDINRSQANFSIEPDSEGAAAVRFGLTAVKNVGRGAIEPIIAERDRDGEFKSIEELCRRCDLGGVNRRVLESLVKAGALDCLGSRGALLNNVERVLSLAQREQRLRESGQTTMFGLWGETVPAPLADLELESYDIPEKEKRAWERELMGVSPLDQPFSPEPGWGGAETAFCGQVVAELVGQNISIAGRVSSVRYLNTKDGRAFASVVLADFSGEIEIMVWPRVFDGTTEFWEEGNELLVWGTVRVRDERVQVSCDRVTRYQAKPSGTEEAALVMESVPAESEEAAVPENGGPATVETEEPAVRNRLVVTLATTSDSEGDITRLREVVSVLREFPGQDEVSLRVTNNGSATDLKMPNVHAGYCPELRQRLVALVGEQGFMLESPATV